FFFPQLHIVHYNSDKYPDINTAVDKSDGLAVLGVLIKIGDFNPAYDQILRFINGARYKNFEVRVPGFNVRELLPARLDEYYQYDGSLTTPPCFPSVLWTVFRNHVTISRQQYLALVTSLHASSVQNPEVTPLNNNFRKPQPIDSRVVLVSFKEDDSFWINTGLLVPILVSCSILGVVLIVPLICCRLRQKRSDQNKSKSVVYNIGDRDEYGSRV
ncbi:carbonic anhydrase 12, partial [Poecilia formosa]|uniref:carbonic anhydrase 12 n=1 Tax=Poecilia formosa TaxID=48698 RepID=UPI0007B7A4D1